MGSGSAAVYPPTGVSMNLEIIKRIDLPGFLGRHYGVTVGPNGAARCPFHDDHEPSLSVSQKNGVGLFKCHGCGAAGSILDFVMKKENLNFADAARHIQEIEGIQEGPRLESAAKTKPEVIREHSYLDAEGHPVFKKTKLRAGSKTDWRLDHYDAAAGAWRPGKNGKDFIPYNLDRFKDHDHVIVAEGEKDADTINALGLDIFATSAPTGCSSWPEEITRYFSKFKEAVFLYDIGNDSHVEKHAAKLRAAFPDLSIKIATVPGSQREFDITDYLGDMDGKADAMLEILAHARPFAIKPKPEQPQGVFVGSLEEFMAADIQAPDPLVDPLVFRSGFSMVGGVKGSHKSFFCIQLGLSLAAGRHSFLNCRIIRPAKVLLIQQEISISFMRERVEKIIRAEQYKTEGRFIPITTTANQLKLVEQKSLDQIKKWIDQYQPEILILDPLSTFHDSEENNSRDQAKIRDVLNRLKARYNLALLITHHFSSKRNPNDPLAPTEVGGWFRGHSCLTDAADVLICLHRLPGQRENPNLPNAYENYNQVQIQLRNGAWPERFAIEFDEESFLLKPSNVWAEFGRKVLPDQVVTLLRANDGSMKRTDILSHFSRSQISPMTVLKGINEAINQRLIEEEKLPGRGAPILFKLKAGA
jgi:KaiC/GvpD/RAD55 family RecA-like ATPase